MPLTTSVKNTMLDALTITAISLHSAYSITGANELTGGSPAYIRQVVTFDAAISGLRFLSTPPYIFDVPAGTVAWIGMWADDASFVGMAPNGGDALRPFVADDTTGTLRSAAHGFAQNDTLVVWSGSASALPGGLVEGAVYYVVAVETVGDLQLSTTLAGSPVTLISTGNGYLQRIVPVINVFQTTFAVNSLALDATVAT